MAIDSAQPEEKPRLAQQAEELVTQLPAREKNRVRGLPVESQFDLTLKRIVDASEGRLSFKTPPEGIDYLLEGPKGDLVILPIVEGQTKAGMVDAVAKLLATPKAVKVLTVHLGGAWRHLPAVGSAPNYQEVRFRSVEDANQLRRAIT